MKDAPLASPLRALHRAPQSTRNLLILVGVLLLLGLLVSRLNLSRSMRRLHVGMASGVVDGHYHAVVDELSRRAAQSRGTVTNVVSAGSADNAAKLRQARADGSCSVAFALVQDGTDFGKDESIQLLGRLPRSESVFFLGKAADSISEFRELSGKRIAAGAPGSGIAQLSAELFALPEFAALGAILTHPSTDDALAQAERGDVDLAMLVMDEDAPLIVSAVRDRGLQVVGFPHADVLARRLPHIKTGRIGAGQFEAVRLLPPVDKRVLRVDTLVVGNGCAGRSATIDLLVLLEQTFPDFIRHNRETPNTTALTKSPTAKSYFEKGGPELADEYVPWLVDIMPPANWVYIVMGVSLLFNAMGAAHRFRLWRIDDARVRIEHQIGALFGPSTTLADIERGTASASLATPETRRAIGELIAALETLASRARRQSLSMLVPMGVEMTYRYQEQLIYEAIGSLRAYLARSDSSTRAS